jgi:glutamate dehydrogenase/leucine dehydrogenase
MNMLELLKSFEEKTPEIIFEWHDAETGAKGYTVINSLRGGAAGGGTRMRKGLDRREVESLAKTMEVKFTVAGPAIGGAKSGIDFDPADPRKHEVLKKWYKAVFPLLKNYYGTGGDLNVDEIHEVIPITEEFGLLHPQEGVVNGHFGDDAHKPQRIDNLRKGVKLRISDPAFSPDTAVNITVADMITGYGVAEAVKHYCQLWQENLDRQTAIIQGWGNVGAAAAWFLAKDGVKIKGIIDREGGLLSEQGFSFDEINQLFLNRDGNKLRAEHLIPFDQINQSIWSIGAGVFVPAAASRLVSKEQTQTMLQHGLKIISCGANVPFRDPEIFFGPTGLFADQQCALIPDFIANCGMARVFAYLMQSPGNPSDQDIFRDVSSTILDALKKVHQRNSNKHGIAATAFEIALEHLV